MLDSFLSVVKPLCRTEPVIDDTASPKAIKIAARIWFWLWIPYIEIRQPTLICSRALLA